MNKVRMLVLLTVLLLIFCGCGREPLAAESVSGPELDPNGQLCCLVEDQTSAEKISDLYGISLVSFDNGVAVFSTEEDPDAVIARGQVNGWPVLSLNTVGEYM